MMSPEQSYYSTLVGALTVGMMVGYLIGRWL